MPESSFEQKIQDKLDELRLRPSAQVWADVESRIRREKRRRRMILWLPLLTLLLGAGITTVWFLWHPKPETTTASRHIPAMPEQAKNPEEDVPGRLPVTVPEENNKRDLPEDFTRVVTPATDQPGVQTPVKENAQAKQTINNREPVLAKAKVISAAKAVFRTQVPGKKAQKKTSAAAGNDQLNKQMTSTVTNTTVKDEPLQTVSTPPAETIFPPTGSVVTSAPELTAVAPVLIPGKTETKSPEVPEAVMKPRPPFRKRFEWGISFAPSFSQVSDALLNVSLGEQKSATQMANPGTTQVAPTPQQTGGISNSLYDIGFSYQAGVFVQKDIFKRSRIRAGLNYAHYTTSIQSGSLISNSVSVINDFGNYTTNGISYRQGVQQSYKTRFSFIEMPLTYALRIGKGKNVPVWMQGSLVPGLLTASNMLHYDSTVAGIYFTDNQRLKRLVFSYETGISLEFGKKSRFPVTVGPQLRFGLSNLLKKEYGQRYILSGGLNITVRKRTQ